jgi:hypothetical protein
MSNFQTRNKTRICDSKIKTQDLRIRKQDVHENVKMNLYYANICKHEHEKNSTSLWCKIVVKIDVERIERNQGSYPYL